MIKQFSLLALIVVIVVSVSVSTYDFETRQFTENYTQAKSQASYLAKEGLWVVKGTHINTAPGEKNVLILEDPKDGTRILFNVNAYNQWNNFSPQDGMETTVPGDTLILTYYDRKQEDYNNDSNTPQPEDFVIADRKMRPSQ